MRRMRGSTAAVLTAALLLPALAIPTAASAQAEPVFQLPFACDETWGASTYPAHWPISPTNVNPVDWNHVDQAGLDDDLGKPVLAGADGGTVTGIGFDPAKDVDGDGNLDEQYGNYVKVAYPGGVELLFAHLDTVSVSTDDRSGSVMAQTQIGTVGSSGLPDSDADHLHYEQRVDGIPRPVLIENGAIEIDFTLPGAMHTSRNCSSGATASSGKPISRPPALPGRVPWSAGEVRSLLSAYEPDSPDGFGITIAGDDTDIVYPVYGGQVIYAGCATGRSASLGRIVVIRQTVEGRNYDTVYGHLSVVDPALVDPVSLALPTVGPSDPIGRFGSTVTGGPLDSCDEGDGGPSRLYVGILRDATIGQDGEISGGRPVYAEPLVGKGVYEKFSWWKGPLTAIDLTETPGAPAGRWANKSTKDGQRIRFGDSVTLMARVKDAAGLRELRFTAYYPGWARKASASRLPGFDQRTTWRILAICRPPGVKGEPAKTKGCKWNGDRNDATVTYEWDPTKVENGKATPWAPRVRTAIGTGTEQCVPVTVSFDVFDASGYQRLTPGGVKRAKKCKGGVASGSSRLLLSAKPMDDEAGPRVFDAKKSPQQNRWVYLDPQRPPAAPGSLSLGSIRTVRIRPGGSFSDARVLRWQDRSGDEDGFRIYARVRGDELVGDPCKKSGLKARSSGWVRVASVPAGATSWRALSATVLDQVNAAAWYGTVIDLRATAYNRAGESQAVSSVSWSLPPGEFFCS